MAFMVEKGPLSSHLKVPIFLLKGGRPPERKSAGAIGYDVYTRALVSETDKDPDDGRFRKTIFDFQTMPDEEELREHIIADPEDSSKLAYVLRPTEHVLIGIGFAMAFQNDMMCWLTPRSGLSMQRLTLTNAPGTLDPDYRGEAGALLVNNSTKDFTLRHETRIAQVIFCPVILPELAIMATMEDLGDTPRSGGGFGSTGLHD
jgi:dUTP pyrophosphatase